MSQLPSLLILPISHDSHMEAELIRVLGYLDFMLKIKIQRMDPLLFQLIDGDPL